ncbi:ComEC/Rec2-related domain protein [Mycoplasma haemocanis str. Illinois]|uniref:ComEC/Rec2-related domain protein n=1 Tax=Mycoplasma haemocanis (strain Illinois) TaxID=1111676 RepID=H6N5M2_MYCHN|nr:ComEC/Rec2 family competence protein [Mycoplasma haemocanis]AEW44982.1 ComEC/Rec2-related domain protein [Mycoplasma haemocanis str. Illinois]
MLSYHERLQGWNRDKNLLFLSLYLVFSFLFLKYPSFIKLLFLIPVLLYVYAFDINFSLVKKAVLLSITLWLITFVPLPKVESTYPSLLNRYFSPHKHLISFVKENYSEKSSELISLLLFNGGKDTSQYYKVFKDLGIAHLVCISGFHFSLISKVIKTLFLGIRRIEKLLIPVVLVLWWSFANYSIPGLRVLLEIFIPAKSRIRRWSASVLISPVFNVEIYASYSFLLSFFISLLLILVKEYNCNSISKMMWAYLLIFIFTTLIFLPIHRKIHFLSFFNLSLFFPIVSALFVYCFLTFWCVPLSSGIEYMMHPFLFLLEKARDNNKVFQVHEWGYDYSYFFLALFSIFLIMKHRRELY